MHRTFMHALELGMRKKDQKNKPELFMLSFVKNSKGCGHCVAAPIPYVWYTNLIMPHRYIRTTTVLLDKPRVLVALFVKMECSTSRMVLVLYPDNV